MDHTPVIEVRNICKSFNGNVVLSHVDLTLHKGEVLVILGRSGSGKSVLIKCIVRLLWPDSGNVFLFDKDIHVLNEIELNHLRRRVGYLFQGAALYDSMNIRDNLLFPLERSYGKRMVENTEALVDEVLNDVGLKSVKDKMPSELSGGMKKRAGLARTLILKPDIVLYDEPTTGLDPFTSNGISELINKVKERYRNSAIVVTHDMKCAKKVADRILILEDGDFIAEGTFDELKAHPDEKVRFFFE